MAVPAPRRSSRSDERLGRIIIWGFLCIPLLWLISMLGEALVDIVPAHAARDGQGVSGIYRVTKKSCGKADCVIAGDFTVAGEPTPLRTGVPIQVFSHRSMDVGQNVPAVEIDGAGVYEAGGTVWSHDLRVLALGSLAVAVWGWLFVWRPLRRRRGALWNNLWGPLPLN
ncbi:hypothetical protein ACH4S8_43525 [Streptomyces sp. NPDC021080]|uniref:hypothetical protein n=1 Tax=Streptomyces sp. NPDC021080 TaxID=3365110 RepID=UPI00378EE01A